MQRTTYLACMQDPLHPQPADVDKPEQQWQAGSLYGAALLQALLSDDQPQSLQAWATAAPAVLDALNEAQAACSGSEGVRWPLSACERWCNDADLQEARHQALVT